jgi:hypothetical protein
MKISRSPWPGGGRGRFPPERQMACTPWSEATAWTRAARGILRLANGSKRAPPGFGPLSRRPGLRNPVASARGAAEFYRGMPRVKIGIGVEYPCFDGFSHPPDHVHM